MHFHRLNFNTWPVAVTLLVFLPWICPWTDLPAPAVLPLLVNLVCLALLMAVMAVSGLHRRALWQAVCLTWAIAALVNTAMATLQYFDLAGSLHPWVYETPPDQIYGNVRQRNLYATLCAMGLAVIVWQGEGVDSVRAGAALARLRVTASALAAACLGVGLAMSASRTGLMELVLLWLVLVGWHVCAPAAARTRATGTRALLVATLACVLSMWLLPQLSGHSETALNRLFNSNETCQSRRLLWGNMWELVMQKPWLGWGWGSINYAHFMTEYQGPRFCGILNNAHNLPLHLAVMLGLPVALLLVAVVGVIIYRAKPWHATDSAQRQAWAVLALIGLHSMVEFPLWTEGFQFAFGLSIWYLYGCRVQGLTAQAWLDTPVWGATGSRVIALAVAGILLLGCALVYSSYDRVRQLFVPPHLRPPAYAKGIGLQAHDVHLFVYEIGMAQLHEKVTLHNAQNMLDLALNALRSQATPLAIERAIAALTLLDRLEEARFYEARYQAIFPQAYARWAASERK